MNLCCTGPLLYEFTSRRRNCTITATAALTAVHHPPYPFPANNLNPSREEVGKRVKVGAGLPSPPLLRMR